VPDVPGVQDDRGWTLLSSEDRFKWDLKWKERGAPGEPSSFLRSLDALLPRTGLALDVAGGAGRHALWLAARGLRTTLVDISDEALAIARAAAGEGGLPLTTFNLDLDHQPLPVGPFDVILVLNFLDRRVYGELGARLAPGGMVVVAHPTRENLRRHPSPSAKYLLEPGELPRLLPGLEALSYEEGWLEEGRHEARLVARRAVP
jgi:SAM-dependent methyltransferase